MDTKICGGSRFLYKMAQYLHITYICIWAIARYAYTPPHSPGFSIVLGRADSSFAFWSILGFFLSELFLIHGWLTSQTS